MYTVDELKNQLGIQEDQELAKIFGVGKSAVTAWKRKGIPPRIVLNAQKLLQHSIVTDKLIEDNPIIKMLHDELAAVSIDEQLEALLWLRKKRSANPPDNR